MSGSAAHPSHECYSPRVPSERDDMLAVSVAGVALRNPVMLAAGTCGYVDEMAEVLDLTRIGGLVTKSITAQPREGNATWRIIEARGGMLNAIGLANVGVDAFVRDYAPKIAAANRRGVTVIGSVAGYAIDEYARVCAAMDGIEGMPAVELNVSCPNVHGGCEFGADPRLLAELLREVRPVLRNKKLFVKLSPIATPTSSSGGQPGIIEIARAAVECGADALCLCNTMPAMAIDVRTRRPRLANRTGGLSGPAIHPIAVKIVYDVYRAACRQGGTPIVGIGGVLTWEDAAEFVLAGATAVEMGSALFADPRSAARVVKGLGGWVRSQGAGSIRELVGAVITE